MCGSRILSSCGRSKVISRVPTARLLEFVILHHSVWWPWEISLDLQLARAYFCISKENAFVVDSYFDETGSCRDRRGGRSSILASCLCGDSSGDFPELDYRIGSLHSVFIEPNFEVLMVRIPSSKRTPRPGRFDRGDVDSDNIISFLSDDILIRYYEGLAAMISNRLEIS